MYVNVSVTRECCFLIGNNHTDQNDEREGLKREGLKGLFFVLETFGLKVLPAVALVFSTIRKAEYLLLDFYANLDFLPIFYIN